MRRNKLSTAIFAGIAGVAGIAATGNAALYLNPDGTGQVLIYPYYTVNNNLQTLISIVNTTYQGKAVKVRFLEGRNSKEVLDFNLYLSEFDVWTAAIISASADTSGPGRLITNDRSCTAPAIPTGGVDFRNFAYATGGTADSGPGALSRTREGHLEVIEMGTVVNTPGPFTPLTWITHVGGTPANCPAIRAAWSPPAGVWLSAPNTGIQPPSGGLFGGAAIVDVANGVMYSYNAEAIDAFRATPLHTNPDNLLPSLAGNNTAPNPRESITFYNGVVVTASWGVGEDIDATSSVFMHSALVNEYALDTVLQAATEWVVTFPTKRFYVDQATVGGAPIAPFTRPFPRAGVSTPAPGRACVDVGIQIYDREEGRPGPGGIDFSPPPPGAAGPQLCWETQVITFNQGARVAAGQPSLLLGSTLYTNIDAASFGFQNGWVSLDFDTVPAHQLRPSSQGFRFVGLPAIGFAVSRYINAAAAPGVLANYSGLWKHRGERTILP
jgi:hypothetical protein